MSMLSRLASASVLILFAVFASPPSPRPSVAVASVILNNMSALPDMHADSETVLLLTREARTRLAECGYPVPSDSVPSITAVHPGSSYLWEHSDVVAQWGAEQHADWVLLSRLSRIGPWVAEWEVQVISTKKQESVSTRIIELKGISRDTSLTAHLSIRGAAWLVDQATQSISHSSGDTAAAGRPCRA
jgi:hypothetical protein